MQRSLTIARAVSFWLVLLGWCSCNPVPPVEGAQVKRAARATTGSASQPRKAGKPVALPELEITPELHPLARLERSELTQLVRTAPTMLGSMSIGHANRGALFNGVAMPAGEHWELVDSDRSWGTQETVDALARAIQAVQREYPGSPKLFIGDMSKRRGGYFRPHRSHQSGRDADIGYYYVDGPAWYKNANEHNLDRVRTWALVKALLAQGNVEYLFIDRSVQLLLKEHALQVEQEGAWVRELFDHPGGKAEGTLRHVRGHKTHIHVRFYSDGAREASRLAYALLARFGKL